MVQLRNARIEILRRRDLELSQTRTKTVSAAEVAGDPLTHFRTVKLLGPLNSNYAKRGIFPCGEEFACVKRFQLVRICPFFGSTSYDVLDVLALVDFVCVPLISRGG